MFILLQSPFFFSQTNLSSSLHTLHMYFLYIIIRQTRDCAACGPLIPKNPLRCSPLATRKEASNCAHSNLCQMLFVSIGRQRRKGQRAKEAAHHIPNKIIHVLYYCSLKEPINTSAQTQLMILHEAD